MREHNACWREALRLRPSVEVRKQPRFSRHHNVTQIQPNEVVEATGTAIVEPGRKKETTARIFLTLCGDLSFKRIECCNVGQDDSMTQTERWASKTGKTDEMQKGKTTDFSLSGAARLLAEF
jgi:hypothetical protein